MSMLYEPVVQEEIEPSAIDSVLNFKYPTIAAVGPVGRLESHDRFARRFGSGALPRAAE